MWLFATYKMIFHLIIFQPYRNYQFIFIYMIVNIKKMFWERRKCKNWSFNLTACSES